MQSGVGNVDQCAVDVKFGILCEMIEFDNLKDVFNRNESRIFFQMAPVSTIALFFFFSENKSQKERVLFMACCNLDRTERLLLMSIEFSADPSCFFKQNGEELQVFLKNICSAWMTSDPFHE